MICKHILIKDFMRAPVHFFCTLFNGFNYCYISHNFTSVICLQT